MPAHGCGCPGHFGHGLALAMQSGKQARDLVRFCPAIHDPADGLIHLLHGQIAARFDSVEHGFKHKWFPVGSRCCV